MENEDIVQEEPVTEAPEENAEDPVQDELESELIALRGEVTELKIRLALLGGGAAPEKLDEGVKLTQGILTADGIQPEEAAAEVLSEYPHIKLAQRTIPRLSAESGGKGDGFAAIRNIFARK